MIEKAELKDFLNYYKIDFLPKVKDINAVKSKEIKFSLPELSHECANCKSCELHYSRNKTVFGSGPIGAKIMFIGEGPGEDEDKTGEPFTGPAGQLLMKAITSGLKMSKEDVYLCNIIKCFPPKNRAPKEEEVKTCFRFLEKQIYLVSPKVIVTLGTHAQKALAGADRGGLSGKISEIRGNWLEFQGIPLMPTFHPAYLLRKVSAKKPFWEDLKEVMRCLEK